MTPLFLDNLPLKNPMQEKQCNYFEGLCSISLSKTGCQIGSPKREKQREVIPFYSETCIQKTCPTTKPSPTTLKHYVNLLLLCVSLKTLCVSLLRNCAASRTLCVNLISLCVDDAGPLAYALSLLGSVWLALASTSRSLPLRWSLNTISTSLSSCPSLLIIDSTLLNNPALENWMTDHSVVFSN